ASKSTAGRARSTSRTRNWPVDQGHCGPAQARSPESHFLTASQRPGCVVRPAMALLTGGDCQDDPDHDEPESGEDRPQPPVLPAVAQLLGPGQGCQDEPGEHAGQSQLGQQGRDQPPPPSWLLAPSPLPLGKPVRP